MTTDPSSAASTRRGFLKTSALAGGTLAMPYFIPASALGRDGAVAPGAKITLGAIGIGKRGTSDLRSMLEESDLQCVAVCDVRKERREAAKSLVDKKYGNNDCVMFSDFRELLARPDIDAVLIATGPNWHALASIMAAKAGKDVYCEKPCTKNIAESLILAETFQRTSRVFQGGMQRRNVPNFVYAIELARSGKLGKLHTMHAHPQVLDTGSSGWTDGQPEPPKEIVDWDMYLGPAAWRPFSDSIIKKGGHFERGGGLVGCGSMEWGTHTVDLCQWANDADHTAAVEYWTENQQLRARYANGVTLVMRRDGWLKSGSCPVRFEGENGWVETGDEGSIFGSESVLELRKGANKRRSAASSHVRDFLDCVRSRNQPRANARVACQSHITCHAADIASFLGRKLVYDPVKNEFPGEPLANRLRSEALREPWHI